jgi:ATP-dependent helicase HepA
MHELHRDPYRPEMADRILSRVPAELEELTEEVVLGLAELTDCHVEDHRDGSRHSIELGHRALVHGLPGVPPGSSYLGTFDREEAVRDEGIDFFAAGHPLVEGVLAHLEDTPAGRVTLLHLRRGETKGLGLLAIYKTGPRFDAVAIDSDGRNRPEWAALLTERPLRSRRVRPESWASKPGWPELVQQLASHLDPSETPVALALFRID